MTTRLPEERGAPAGERWERAWGIELLPKVARAAAIVFSPAPGARPAAMLALGFAPEGGALCVVGQPGRVGLGRLERGLRKWVEATCPRPETGPAAPE